MEPKCIFSVLCVCACVCLHHKTTKSIPRAWRLSLFLLSFLELTRLLSVGGLVLFLFRPFLRLS